MTIQARLIAGFIALILGIGIGWKICSWRDQAAMDAKDKAIIAAQQNAQGIASVYELARQNQTQTIADLQKKIRKEHAANPNSGCAINADGLLDIRSAIESAR